MAPLQSWSLPPSLSLLSWKFGPCPKYEAQRIDDLLPLEVDSFADKEESEESC